MIRDRVVHERLRTALADTHPVRIAQTEREVLAMLNTGPVALIVIEIAAASSLDEATSFVRRMRARYASTPIVGYCHARRELGREIVDLVRAGVHDLLFVDIDDDRARLHSLVGQTTRRSVAEDVVAHAAAAGLSDLGCTLLQTFLDVADRPLSVQQIAESLRIHRRTLFQRVETAHLPAPQVLMGWCRLLLAARLLDTTAHTIERIAHDLGFASGNALRNLLQRQAGLSPTRLRASGGYGYLRDCFLAHVPGSRATSPERATNTTVCSPADWPRIELATRH